MVKGEWPGALLTLLVAARWPGQGVEQPLQNPGSQSPRAPADRPATCAEPDDCAGRAGRHRPRTRARTELASDMYWPPPVSRSRRSTRRAAQAPPKWPRCLDVANYVRQHGTPVSTQTGLQWTDILLRHGGGWVSHWNGAGRSLDMASGCAAGSPVSRAAEGCPSRRSAAWKRANATPTPNPLSPRRKPCTGGRQAASLRCSPAGSQIRSLRLPGSGSARGPRLR